MKRIGMFAVLALALVLGGCGWGQENQPLLSLDIVGSSDFSIDVSDDDTGVTQGDGGGDISVDGCGSCSDDGGGGGGANLCSLTSCTDIPDELCFQNGGPKECKPCSECTGE